MARSLKIRRDDNVRVMAGKDRGKTGRVLRVDPGRERIYVEGINMRKRHQRAQALPGQQAGQGGGVIESEGPVHISNVMLLDPNTNEPTRVSIQRDQDGRRRRVARRSGEVID
ncbi:MAG TPA: 50S ribosomal protein L24 [Thermoleophilaceae bacterium]|nr:50S ribosomal protein L24 [Thermoleophilaceae bacterium]